MSTYPPTLIKKTSRGWQRVGLETAHFMNRELFLNDEVNSESMQSLIQQLITLDRENPEKEITLFINSPGGDVRSGLAAYAVMEHIKAPIRTVCTGLAASMGAILFLGGRKREMLPHTQIMIHDPATGFGAILGMKPEEMKKELEYLVEAQTELCEIIAEKTGKTLEEVKEVTAQDAYFNFHKALDYGLATGAFSGFSYENNI